MQLQLYRWSLDASVMFSHKYPGIMVTYSAYINITTLAYTEIVLTAHRITITLMHSGYD